jgi:hypothetical protein
MARVLVRFGVHRDRLDAHPAGGLDDPAGNLAAIGNQDFFEHLLLAAKDAMDAKEHKEPTG